MSCALIMLCMCANDFCILLPSFSPGCGVLAPGSEAFCWLASQSAKRGRSNLPWAASRTVSLFGTFSRFKRFRKTTHQSITLYYHLLYTIYILETITIIYHLLLYDYDLLLSSWCIIMYYPWGTGVTERSWHVLTSIDQYSSHVEWLDMISPQKALLFEALARGSDLWGWMQQQNVRLQQPPVVRFRI